MEVDFRKLFTSPVNYNPPNDCDLASNTQFPNMNSIEYRRRAYESVEPKFFEKLAANDAQTTVLLATNSYVNRYWESVVYVYKKFDDVVQQTNALQRLPFNTNINHMRFINDILVMLTTSDGSIQIWCAQSHSRQDNGSSMYQVTSRQEHYDVVTSFDLLSKKKAISGSTDGCLKIWTIEPCDLSSAKTFRTAHTDTITGLAGNPKNESIFASCSSDAVVAVWDDRLMSPIISYNESSDIGYTACHWHSNGGVEKLYLGDQIGTVSVYDPRKLDTCEKRISVNDQPIHKISFNANGDLLCILDRSNAIRVFDKNIDGSIVYENAEATDYVRDICWDRQTKDGKRGRFYSIDWSGHANKHTIQ